MGLSVSFRPGSVTSFSIRFAEMTVRVKITYGAVSSLSSDSSLRVSDSFRDDSAYDVETKPFTARDRDGCTATRSRFQQQRELRVGDPVASEQSDERGVSRHVDALKG